VIAHNSMPESVSLDSEATYDAAIAHRYVHSNVDPISGGESSAYHFVARNVRQSNADIKAWLESIKAGDSIVVYPRCVELEGFINQVASVEMTLYWGE
jgi:hypothetical protein